MQECSVIPAWCLLITLQTRAHPLESLSHQGVCRLPDFSCPPFFSLSLPSRWTSPFRRFYTALLRFGLRPRGFCSYGVAERPRFLRAATNPTSRFRHAASSL